LVKYVTPFILLCLFVFQPKAHAQFGLSTLASYAVGAFNYVKESATNLIPEPLVNDYPTTCDLITTDDPLRFGPIQPGFVADLGVQNYSLFLQHGQRSEVLNELNKAHASLSCRENAPGPISSFFRGLGNSFMPCSQTVGSCKHADHIVNMTSLCNCVIDKTGSDTAKQYVPFKSEKELDTMIEAVREEFTKIALEDTLADIDRVADVSTNLVLSEDFNPLLGIKEGSSVEKSPINAHLCMGGAIVHQIKELFEGNGANQPRCRPESAELMLEAYIKLHQCANPGEDCIDFHSLLNDPRMKTKSAHEKLGILLTTQHSKYIDPTYGLSSDEKIPVGNDMVFRFYELSAGIVDPKTLAYRPDVGFYSDPYPNINEQYSFDFMTRLVELASNGSVMTASSLNAFSSEDKKNFINYLKRNPIYGPFIRENQNDDHAILSFTSSLIHHHNNNPDLTNDTVIDHEYIGKIWGLMAIDLARESQKNCDKSRTKLANLCEALSGDGMALFSSPDFASIFTKLSSLDSGEKFAKINGNDNLAAFFRTEQVLCHANRRSLQTRCDQERQRSTEQGPPLPAEHCAYDASWLFDKNVKAVEVAEKYSGEDRPRPALIPTSSTAKVDERPSVLSGISSSDKGRPTIRENMERVLSVSKDINPTSRSVHPLAAIANNSKAAQKFYTQSDSQLDRSLPEVKGSTASLTAADSGISGGISSAAYISNHNDSSFREANSFINPITKTNSNDLPGSGGTEGNVNRGEKDALQVRLDRLLEERLKKIEAQKRLVAELEQSESGLEQDKKARELADLKEELAQLNSDISKQRAVVASRRVEDSSEKAPSVTRKPASIARAEISSGGINNGLDSSRGNLNSAPVTSTGGAGGNPSSLGAGNINAGRRLTAGGNPGASGAAAGARAAEGSGLTLRQTTSASATTLPVGTPISQLVTRLNDQGVVLRETGVPGQTERIIFALDEFGEVLYVNNEPVFTIEIININSKTAVADKPQDDFQEFLERRRQYRWESVIDAIDTAKKD